MSNAKEQDAPSKDALSSSQAAHNGKAPPKTRGEKLFNALDYWGLGWIANATVSVMTADLLNHTHLKRQGDAGKRWLARLWAPKENGAAIDNTRLTDAENFFTALKEHHPEAAKEALHEGDPVRGLFKKIGEPTQELLEKLKDSGTLREAATEEFELLRKTKLASNSAGFWLSFGALNLGGWLMMVPMKLMEDRKEKIVKKLDDNLYSKHMPKAQEAAIQARHEAIHREPRQSWGSVLLSRTLGTPIIFTLYGQTAFRSNPISKAGIPFEGMEHYAEAAANKAESILARNNPEGLEKLENFLGKTPERLGTMQKTVTEAGEAQSAGKQRFHALVQYSYIETIYSLMMASIVFVWTRVLGPVLGIKPADETAPAEHPIKTPKIPEVGPSQAPATTVVNGMVIDIPQTKVAQASLEPTTHDKEKPTRKENTHGPHQKHRKPEAIASHVERMQAQPEIPVEAAR